MEQTYCFFKTSTSPAFVRSLPSIAFLKSLRSSGGRGFLGCFSVEARVLEPMVASGGLEGGGCRRVLEPLTTCKGRRGGGISLAGCEDVCGGGKGNVEGDGQ